MKLRHVLAWALVAGLATRIALAGEPPASGPADTLQARIKRLEEAVARLGLPGRFFCAGDIERLKAPGPEEQPARGSDKVEALMEWRYAFDAALTAKAECEDLVKRIRKVRARGPQRSELLRRLQDERVELELAILDAEDARNRYEK